ARLHRRTVIGEIAQAIAVHKFHPAEDRARELALYSDAPVDRLRRIQGIWANAELGEHWRADRRSAGIVERVEALAGKRLRNDLQRRRAIEQAATEREFGGRRQQDGCGHTR